MSKTLVLKAQNAMVTPNEVVEDAVIVIQDGCIHDVGRAATTPVPRRGSDGWTMAIASSPRA